MTTAKAPELIDETFTASITTDANSDWTCVVMPESGDVFDTRKVAKVAGTIDSQPFQATLLPMGDGTHMVPLRAAFRKALGKGIGDNVPFERQRKQHTRSQHVVATEHRLVAVGADGHDERCVGPVAEAGRDKCAPHIE